jgi:DNA-binding NtrC family response regulator
VIVFVSKSEADYRTLREVAGLVSQSVVSCAHAQQARKAIRRHDPEIVVCEARAAESGRWQELLEETQAAQSLMLVVSRHADERLWAEVLKLRGFDVLSLPFDRDELRRALSSALHIARALRSGQMSQRPELILRVARNEPIVYQCSHCDRQFSTR